jgi:hypothetical protein
MDTGEDLFGRHTVVLGRYTDGMLSSRSSMALARDRHSLPCLWRRRCDTVRISVPVLLQPPASRPRIRLSDPIRIPVPHRIGNRPNSGRRRGQERLRAAAWGL